MRPPTFLHLRIVRPHTLVPRLSSCQPRTPPLPLPLLNSLPKTCLAFFSQSHRLRNQYQPYLNHDNHHHQQPIHPPSSPPPPPPPFPPRRSLRSRFIRSLLWAIIFGSLGCQLALQSWLTLYKFQSTIELDSEADQRFALGLWRTMEAADPRLRSIEASPVLEEIWPLATDLELTRAMHANPNPTRFHHLIYTALRGSRGVRARAFLKPSRCEMLVFVAFSYGLEGSPEQAGGCAGALHNGAVATMVEESMSVLAQHWFPPEVSHKLSNLHLSFATGAATATGDNVSLTPPLRASSAYHIFLQPAATCGLYVDPSTTSDPHSHSHSHDHPQSSPAPVDVPPPNATDSRSMRVMDTEIAMPLDQFPAWFDPTDWNDIVNSFVAIVVPVGAPGGTAFRPSSETSTPAAAVCFGRFDVEVPPPHAPKDVESKADAEAGAGAGDEGVEVDADSVLWPPRPPRRPVSYRF